MTRLEVGNVFTQIASGTEAACFTAYNALSYRVKDFMAIKKRMSKTNPRMRHWDGTKSFFDRRSKRFMTGFLPRVLAAFKADGIPFELVSAMAKPVGAEITGEIPSLFGITLRDYQIRAINDFFRHKRGVAKLATGAGKTEVAIAITAKAGVPTIFLTHRVNLLHQTAERFKKRLPHLANKIGIIGNGDCNPNFITIATVQTLHGFIKKDPHATHDMLSQFKLLIIDEAHRSGSKQFYETAQFCSNAHLRLALTATPFMKGNEEEDMYLEGITGGIITSISAGELIEAGVLAKPFFRFIPVDTPLRQRLTNWRDIYELGVVKNVARNKIVVQQTMKLVEMEKKTLVIVHEVTHGKILEKVMRDMGINAEYIDGRNTFTERERALKKLSSGRLDVIICTNIFDEGVDAGEIGAVVLAAGCKSAPALFQRTGRAVRRKEENNFAIIIDFIDKHHPKLLEHSMERYELIRNESGFTIV